MTFGEKVRKARLARGMTQKQLADESGIALRTIINYENNQKYPKQREYYEHLARALGMDVQVLMDDGAPFALRDKEEYGSHASRQAETIVQDVKMLFSSGELSEEEMDEAMQAIQNAYWEARSLYRGRKT